MDEQLNEKNRRKVITTLKPKTLLYNKRKNISIKKKSIKNRPIKRRPNTKKVPSNNNNNIINNEKKITTTTTATKYKKKKIVTITLRKKKNNNDSNNNNNNNKINKESKIKPKLNPSKEKRILLLKSSPNKKRRLDKNLKSKLKHKLKIVDESISKDFNNYKFGNVVFKRIIHLLYLKYKCKCPKSIISKLGSKGEEMYFDHLICEDQNNCEHDNYDFYQIEKAQKRLDENRKIFENCLTEILNFNIKKYNECTSEDFVINKFNSTKIAEKYGEIVQEDEDIFNISYINISKSLDKWNSKFILKFGFDYKTSISIDLQKNKLSDDEEIKLISNFLDVNLNSSKEIFNNESKLELLVYRLNRNKIYVDYEIIAEYKKIFFVGKKIK